MTDASAGGDWPRTTRILPWCIAIFVAMVWLLPFDSMTLPISVPLAGKLDRALILLIGGLWILSLVAAPRPLRPRVRFRALHVAAVAFFIVASVGAVLNAQSLADLGQLGLTIKKLVLLASYLFVLILVPSIVRPAEVPRFVAFMVSLAGLAALGTVIEYRLHYNVFYTWANDLPFVSVTKPPDLDMRDSVGRLSVYGPSGQPLEAATLLALAMPFALLGLFDSQSRRRRLLYGAVAALILAGSMSTLRKTSVIAPLAAIAVLFVYRPRIVLRRGLPLLAAFAFVVHGLAPQVMGSLFDQLHPNRLVGTLSTQDRASDYDGVRPDVIDHPIFGRGYKSFDPRTYRVLDNDYLGLIVGTGFAGLISYLVLIVVAFATAARWARSGDPTRGPPAIGAAAAVAVVAVTTALFDLLSFPHIPYALFFVLGLVLAGAESPHPGMAGSRSAPRATSPARPLAPV